jgi:hypothetical protein
MNGGLSVITSIYQAMHESGIVRTKAEFSSQWLLRDQSYLTSMQTRNRRPTCDVTKRLTESLQEEINALLSGGMVLDQALRKRLIALTDALILAEAKVGDAATMWQPPAPVDRSPPQPRPISVRT